MQQRFTLISDMHSGQQETKKPNPFPIPFSSLSYSCRITVAAIRVDNSEGSSPLFFFPPLPTRNSADRFAKIGSKSRPIDTAGHYSCHLKYPAENIRPMSARSKARLRESVGGEELQTGIMQKGFLARETGEESLCRPLTVDALPGVSPPP